VSALGTIRVTATQDACQPGSFAGFDCRRKAGLGVFLDPAKVNALNPRDLADLFDGVPGLRREGEVMAVEFYADRNAAPEWYKIYAGKCSLIVLWTNSQ
jgi:hypothetical protein